MGSEFLGIVILFVFSALVAIAMLVLTSFLGPKRPNPVKDQPFECGLAPIELPQGKSSVKFYLVAMLFVIFDVEVVFLFPWAVVFRQLGLAGFFPVLFFLAVILLGFWYVVKRGALNWE